MHFDSIFLCYIIIPYFTIANYCEVSYALQHKTDTNRIQNNHSRNRRSPLWRNKYFSKLDKTEKNHMYKDDHLESTTDQNRDSASTIVAGQIDYESKYRPFLEYDCSAQASGITSSGNVKKCRLPSCKCQNSKIPGNLKVSSIPQFVMLTFDDAINAENYDLYLNLSHSRINPDGCPSQFTFFVSHEWTNYQMVGQLYDMGHEIASHSISHRTPQTWWKEEATYNDWRKEISGQRELIHKLSNVPIKDIKGMRAPFLQSGGNIQFKMLTNHGFKWDSSLPSPRNDPPIWPYTLHSPPNDCQIHPCITKSYEKIWEVPLIDFLDDHKSLCSMVDQCSLKTEEAEHVFEFLGENFLRHYGTNKAPFPLFLHSGWLTNSESRKLGFIKFLDTIAKLEDVYLVTISQTLEWVANPKELDRMRSIGSKLIDINKARNEEILKERHDKVSNENSKDSVSTTTEIYSATTITSDKSEKSSKYLRRRRVKRSHNENESFQSMYPYCTDFDRELKSKESTGCEVKQWTTCYYVGRSLAIGGAQDSGKTYGGSLIGAQASNHYLHVCSENCPTQYPWISDHAVKKTTIKRTKHHGLKDDNYLELRKRKFYEGLSKKSSPSKDAFFKLFKDTSAQTTTEDYLLINKHPSAKVLTTQSPPKPNQEAKDVQLSAKTKYTIFGRKRKINSSLAKKYIGHLDDGDNIAGSDGTVKRLKLPHINQLIPNYGETFNIEDHLGPNTTEEPDQDIGDYQPYDQGYKSIVPRSRIRDDSPFYPPKYYGHIGGDNEDHDEGPYTRECLESICRLPKCRCAGTDIPADLKAKKVPQIILLSFSGAVNEQNFYTYLDILGNVSTNKRHGGSPRPRLNPNGCPISMTFFVSHEWTNYQMIHDLHSRGHEIALNSISYPDSEWWKNADDQGWRSQLTDQKKLVSKFADISESEILGVRVPYMETGGDTQFRVLEEEGFLYDSSIPTANINPPLWPYTLDYKSPKVSCTVGSCPIGSFAGIWEIPLVNYVDGGGDLCTTVPACKLKPSVTSYQRRGDPGLASKTADSRQVYDLLVGNFRAHYDTNRAPFPIALYWEWLAKPVDHEDDEGEDSGDSDGEGENDNEGDEEEEGDEGGEEEEEKDNDESSDRRDHHYKVRRRRLRGRSKRNVRVERSEKDKVAAERRRKRQTDQVLSKAEVELKESNLRGLLDFLDMLSELDDVYVITHKEAIDWVQRPTETQVLINAISSRRIRGEVGDNDRRHNKASSTSDNNIKEGPWYCGKALAYEEKVANGDDNKCPIQDYTTCSYDTQDAGHKYFFACGDCPATYPWVGNPLGD